APAPAVAAPPAPPPQAEPEVRHPIEAARPETTAEPAKEAPLPPLAASDKTVLGALAGLVGRKALAAFLADTGIVQRFVATVDNLPRSKASPRVWPVRPTAGRFTTTERNDGVYLGAENERRYEPLLQLMESADTGKLVALYVRLYPLFQQAYAELGYPKRHFNDRLIEVIDHLLATPELKGPIRLVPPEVKGPVRLERPWVLYEFADPDLEARSAGQKILLRMGAGNAGRVKAKLRDARRQLTQRGVTP
ncbi:MAG: DUF3014 domain-containing protein, partial [Burkholderiales bacterium]